MCYSIVCGARLMGAVLFVPELQKIFLAADLSREQFFIVILGALAPTAVIQVYKLFV